MSNTVVDTLAGVKSPFLYFREASVQRTYEEYRVKEVSHVVFLLIMIIGTIMQGYYAAQAESARFVDVLAIVRALRLLFLIPGWTFCYRIYSLRREQGQNNYYFSTAFLANTTLFSFIMTLAMVLTVRTIIGACRSGEATSNCNNGHELNELPTDAAMSLIFVILGIQALIKCYNSSMLCACWCVSFITIVFCIVWAKATSSTFLVVFSILVAFILYEYERNTYNTFIALYNMEHSIRTRLHVENEKRLMEMRSVEMRHLLGNVAHDLKTPMQSFVMELELVDKMIKRPASQTAELITYVAHDVQQMVSSLHNLTDTNSFMYMVINRAIDFAKSSSDRSLVPNLETINVTKTIQWAIDVVKSKCTVPLILEPLSGDIYPNIITDKQWLIENILCLISNAAKFTTTGSVIVRCELICAVTKSPHDDIAQQGRDAKENSTSSSGDELLIEVEDTGIGIPEEKRESMFRPFQQTMRMAGGTGLGLYSLRNRVDALKGSCGISDRRDGADGARIWFKIPYRPDEMTTVDDISETKDDIQMIPLSILSSPVNRVVLDTNRISEATFNDCAKCHVLVADDSGTIRKSISRVLMNEGLSVDLAENGQMALEMMGLKRYDLVLMDLQMPVMDGLEAVRRLRKQESESGGEYHQKVIGISAYAGEPYCSDAINAGMDGFIEKPFSAKRFLEVCEQQGVSLNH